MNDIITEHRNKIMDILDKFYEILKVYNKRWIQVFVEEEIPNKFLTGEIEEENWKGTILKFKTWKYIPSDITENEILEKAEEIQAEISHANELGSQFPTSRRDYERAQEGIKNGEENYTNEELNLWE